MQIKSEVSNTEKGLNDTMYRLRTLGDEVNLLKTKHAKNSMAVARAEETATMAKEKAVEAKQVCVCGMLLTANFEIVTENSPVPTLRS